MTSSSKLACNRSACWVKPGQTTPWMTLLHMNPGPDPRNHWIAGGSGSKDVDTMGESSGSGRARVSSLRGMLAKCNSISGELGYVTRSMDAFVGWRPLRW